MTQHTEAEVRELLVDLEWSVGEYDRSGDSKSWCPDCGGCQTDYCDGEAGHKAGCRLSAMLAAAAQPSGNAAVVDVEPGSREGAMVVIQRDENGAPTVWCDPEIVDLVTALNQGSVTTTASCSGHGERFGTIMLADGRELIVSPDYYTTRLAERLLPSPKRLREIVTEMVAYHEQDAAMAAEAGAAADAARGDT
ncbi:hypothetical protein N8I74_15825 [Chitiniphilus purpureus]|uniref:Uncharacterized protein n=1 Tax=Chitiniphilus purpureus TaxID=2981137 RepID=A0ABY6DKB3_9NEIS|nr:hypothetical protein [Chitiniphilus sp. CD1]UXY14772.1 hypothetical protein N8I74_15825 [Chitiniphilus sp. CD1]